MRIDVSEPPVLCGCDTCVQHRTQETEPSNVIGSSLAPVPVSSEPVQALGSTSDQSSGTKTPPLAPPVTTTSVINPEPAQSINSTIFKFPPAVTPVSSEPAQALAPAFGFGAFAAHRPFSLGASATSKVNGSSPTSFAPPVSSAPVQEALGTATTAASSTSSPVHSSSPTTFQFHPAFTSAAASGPSITGPIQAPAFGCGASTTSSPFDAPSPLRWGSVQANIGPNTFTPFSFLPAQDSRITASTFPPSFSHSTFSPSFGGFARPDVGVSPTAPSRYFDESNLSSPLGRAPKNPFGTYLHPWPGVACPSNVFGPNSQTTQPVSGRSPFWDGVGTEQGSRYPRYAPTPDLLDSSGGQGMRLMSISASNSHGHKSHEELRWEDYKNGDKGGFGWFPPAHTSPFPSPTVSSSLFAPPSIPDRPRMRTIDLTHQNMSGFPMGYNIPTAVQRPHEPAAVSSPASGGCTACGATSSSSPSAHVGLNNTTNPPSSATSLPGFFFPTYGSFPLLFATPNLAAQGTTTTPAAQPYPMMFGTPNLLAAQGTTTTAPAAQLYPMMFGTPNLLAAQGTTTTAPAAQIYPIMFGTPNLAAQGTTATPAVQPYAMIFGTPSLTAQGTTTTPAAQLYPMMFGTPSLAAQGTTTTTPAVQPYAMMFGTPNPGAQGITPAAQASPVNGLNLPFSAMTLQ